MALADPQQITVDTTPVDLARIGQSLNEGKFKDGSGEYSLSVTHTQNSRYRHSAQLRWDDVVSNPLVPDQNVAVFASVGLTINAPKNGLSNAQVAELADAFVAWLTPATVAKLIAGES